MSEIGRNRACPCGSGKRYKDCHGALPTSASANVSDGAHHELDAALAAQKAGRIDDAIALYESVIARHPFTFDALHMLGVVHYQRGDYERALDLVASALALLPTDRGARYNLQLVESALERRAVARDICRETLPRLGRRCIVAGADDRERWRNAPLDVIVSTHDASGTADRLAALIAWLAAATFIWRYPDAAAPPEARWPTATLDSANGVLPRQRHALFFGAERSPAGWYAQSVAAEVTLFCDDDAPRVLLDRIPELAREGATPLRLLFASKAIAHRVGLPGIVVADAAIPA